MFLCLAAYGILTPQLKNEMELIMPTDVTPPAPEPQKKTKTVEYDGYSFEVDTDLVDDVEVVDLIDKIENQQSLKAIVEFLQYLVGKDGYEKMKAFFVQRDGRFRLSKLSGLYEKIFENFDPKG